MDGYYPSNVVQTIHHGTAANVAPPLNLGRSAFDGKRMRKPITRKAVDYAAPVMQYLQNRAFEKDISDIPPMQGHEAYVKDMYPPSALPHIPTSNITGKYIHTSTNKIRCPVNAVVWTPEGRRLITGSGLGEFTLWNGTTFNFETIQQAHDTAIRSMVWTYSDNWLITGDHSGQIKYWQPNLNNVKSIQAHKEAVRGISFARTDAKFASCSDDVTLKVWDYATCQEELQLKGHGWDIKGVSWHPFNSLIVSGSKDNLIKLWDAKSPNAIATIHAHKNTVSKVHWNQNGNWFLSCSKDQLLKVIDVRTMKEIQAFKGHRKEVTACQWHPTCENFFVSGDFEGQIMFWTLGCSEVQGEIYDAHDGAVWDLQWHPLGHVLCSGSNDHSTKFWCRNRPGDTMQDRYNSKAPTINADLERLREEEESGMAPKTDEEKRAAAEEKLRNALAIDPAGIGAITPSASIPGLGHYISYPSTSVPRTQPAARPQGGYGGGGMGHGPQGSHGGPSGSSHGPPSYGSQLHGSQQSYGGPQQSSHGPQPHGMLRGPSDRPSSNWGPPIVPPPHFPHGPNPGFGVPPPAPPPQFGSQPSQGPPPHYR